MDFDAMKKLLLAGLLALLPSLAHAQCTGIFQPGTLCGNNTGTAQPPFQVSSSTSIIGPGTTVVNDLALWGNLTGSQLIDKAPGALTKVDDTNVILTLGGSATTALVNAASITAGWTGTLAAGRLNSNVVQSVVNDTNVTGSIAAQALTLGWTGTLAAARLNGNVVQAFTNDTNVTGSITAQNATLGWAGTLALARGGTGAATQAGAAASIFPTPVTTGDIVYWNGAAWISLAGNSIGTQVLQENSSGVPSWVTVSGTGTVTALTPGAGIVSSVAASCSQSDITTTGTLSSAHCVNPQTGATYAIVDGDRAKLITASNAASQAYTIAQAGAASAFQSGWHTDIMNISTLGAAGAGVVTVTATTSTFSATGATTLKIYPGQTVRIISDGANYQTVNLNSIAGSKVLLAKLAASSSATLSDTISLTSAFNEYEIVFENILPATNGVTLEFQVHSGGSFPNANYLAATHFTSSSTAVINPTTFIQLSGTTLVQNTGFGFSGRLTIYTPSNTSAVKAIHGSGVHVNTAAVGLVEFGGYWVGGAGAIDGFQILFNSGNIASGTIKVYGMK